MTIRTNQSDGQHRIINTECCQIEGYVGRATAHCSLALFDDTKFAFGGPSIEKVNLVDDPVPSTCNARTILFDLHATAFRRICSFTSDARPWAARSKAPTASTKSNVCEMSG